MLARLRACMPAVVVPVMLMMLTVVVAVAVVMVLAVATAALLLLVAWQMTADLKVWISRVVDVVRWMQ